MDLCALKAGLIVFYTLSYMPAKANSKSHSTPPPKKKERKVIKEKRKFGLGV